MSHNPFILNLGFLVAQDIGESHDFPFELEKVDFNDNFSLSDFNGNLSVSRTPQGLLLHGNFEGKLSLECVRCLKNYDHLLEWEITELYVFNGENATEDDLIFPRNARVDIRKIMSDEAQLKIPINPICKPDCQGLCQICGTDLNLGDCEHQDIPQEENEQSASPFAGLKDLL